MTREASIHRTAHALRYARRRLERDGDAAARWRASRRLDRMEDWSVEEHQRRLHAPITDDQGRTIGWAPTRPDPERGPRWP